MNESNPGNVEKSDFLARLKNISEITTRISEANSSGLINTEFGTNGWERDIRILKSQARTKAIQNGQPELRELIDLFVIIKDGNIPNAHNNEIEISEFKKRYL